MPSSPKQLEAEKLALLASCSLLAPTPSPDLPPSLGALRDESVRDLLASTGYESGFPGACAESARYIVEALQSSERGYALRLESDITLLRQLGSQSDIEQESSLGYIEGLYPVRVSGTVVHWVWSGRLLRGPLDEEHLARLASLTGASAETLRECRGDFNGLTEAQIRGLLDQHQRLRDLLERSLASIVHRRDLSTQLIQSERTRSLGTLSGGVAHHFNNLLSVILGYSSFVSHRETLSDEAREALRHISEAAQRGRRLTEEILAFSGDDPGKDTVCALHDTLRSVLSLLQSQSSSRVHIATRLDAAEDHICAPASSIHQIVFNLLANAMDAMPEGGDLHVATSNVTLGPQTFLKLEVSDSAGSLPSNFSQQLAEGGLDETSLRLSSIYGMVGRLDGTVTISNHPGQATRVEVLMPVAGEQAAAKPPRQQARQAPSTIWVVDDDPIFRQMCKQVLSDVGHQVEELTSGLELKERWPTEGQRPALLIIDFSMPEFNGRELSEWVREQGATTPIVLVSGFASNQPDIRAALSIPNTHFLQKPFTVPELADRVTVALGETLMPG